MLQEYAALPHDHRFICYVDDLAISVPSDPRFEVRAFGPAFYPVWEQFALPLHLKRDALDVFHSPGNTAPFLHGDVPLVLTIHDVLFMLGPGKVPAASSTFQRLQRLYYRKCAPRAAARAQQIVTISEYSAKDIKEVFPDLKTPLRVIHSGPGNACPFARGEQARTAVAAATGSDMPFVFTLGARDPRKNTSLVVDAFAKIANDVQHDLVIAGLDRATREELIKTLPRSPLRERVHVLPFVEESLLCALYNAADLFVYLSAYEGFGFPVLEAMGCGTPVIASNTSSIPEIAARAAILVDPSDVSVVAQEMVRALSDSQLYDDLVIAGRERAASFSWKRTALAMLAVFEETARAR